VWGADGSGGDSASLVWMRPFQLAPVLAERLETAAANAGSFLEKLKKTQKMSDRLASRTRKKAQGGGTLLIRDDVGRPEMGEYGSASLVAALSMVSASSMGAADNTEDGADDEEEIDEEEATKKAALHGGKAQIEEGTGNVRNHSFAGNDDRDDDNGKQHQHQDQHQQRQHQSSGRKWRDKKRGSTRGGIPSLVSRVFVGPMQTERDRFGVYTMRLFISGKWRSVTIDDRLPVTQSRRFAFCSCSDVAQMWVPLIEKALAKALGSYAAVTTSHPLVLIQCLTGMLTETVQFGKHALRANHRIHKRENVSSVGGQTRSELRELVKQMSTGEMTPREYALRRRCVSYNCSIQDAWASMIGSESALESDVGADSLWERLTWLTKSGACVGASQAGHVEGAGDKQCVLPSRMYGIVAVREVRTLEKFQTPNTESGFAR
jgi:hypothetical protein